MQVKNTLQINIAFRRQGHYSLMSYLLPTAMLEQRLHYIAMSSVMLPPLTAAKMSTDVDADAGFAAERETDLAAAGMVAGGHGVAFLGALQDQVPRGRQRHVVGEP
ncbi:MAG TPA: hypothetical protein VFS82_05345 [Lysobacter sp.]|nr:hypothetical protein [Lysobacter sp.]